MPFLPPRWTLCVLLFLATTLNYVDRQALGILAPIIQKDLGIDNAALGTLFAIFYFAYTLAQFAVGGLLDRWNLRWAYGFGVLGWSLVAALTATASSFAGLAVFRLLLGVTESVNWPAAMRMVARSLPPRERSLGNGIFTSGTSIGALIAPATILGIARVAGWRWGFAVVGSLGLLWFLLWIYVTRSAAYTGVWRPEESPNGNTPALGGYAEVLANPQFWRVFLVAILVNPCLYFLLNWLPTYLSQQRDFTPEAMIWVLTLIFLGLDFGYLFCGTAVMFLTRHKWGLARARRFVIGVGTALLSVSALVPYTMDITTVVTLLVMSNFGAGCWIAMYLTMAQEVSEKHVATAAGLLGGSGSLAGAAAMWGVGQITHLTSSFTTPLACIAVVACVAFLAGIAVVRHRPFGTMADPETA